MKATATEKKLIYQTAIRLIEVETFKVIQAIGLGDPFSNAFRYAMMISHHIDSADRKLFWNRVAAAVLIITKKSKSCTN